MSITRRIMNKEQGTSNLEVEKKRGSPGHYLKREEFPRLGTPFTKTNCL
jgi:hypothetical protein